MTTHEDDDDSATLQRARAGGQAVAVATTGVRVNAYAAGACLRARKWTTTSEGARGLRKGKTQLGNHASVVKSPVIHREILLPFPVPRTAIRRVCMHIAHYAHMYIILALVSPRSASKGNEEGVKCSSYRDCRMNFIDTLLI